jgi:hypothetical protein
MKKKAANISASVLARLKNIADREHIDFNLLLLRYMQERFLCRLATSGHVNRFVLKGGFLLLAYNIERARPTRDIDFLGVDISGDRKDVESVIGQIASIDIDDGVRFLPDSVRSEVIKEDAEYAGVRIKLTAKIGTARNPIRIDVAFGDVVSPYPLQMDYPTLLDRGSIKVLAYSKETIVAEKFEAIVKLTTFNTRMKDFYDLAFLSGEFDFEGRALQEALRNTFTRRQTSLASGKGLLESEFAERANFQRHWGAFKVRTRIASKQDFKNVFEAIRAFLAPVIDAELENKLIDLHWTRKTMKWE